MNSSQASTFYTFYVGGKTYEAIAKSRREAESAFVAFITRNHIAANLLCCGLKLGQQVKFCYWVMISAETMMGVEYPIACSIYNSIIAPTEDFASRYRKSRRLRMSLNSLSYTEGIQSVVFREMPIGSLKKIVWEDDCPWMVYSSRPFPNAVAFHRGLLLSHRIRKFEPRVVLQWRTVTGPYIVKRG